MKTLTTKDEAQYQAVQPRARGGSASAMPDASAATATLQRYQQLAASVPMALQLRERAHAMAVSGTSVAMRALQRAPEEELAQAKTAPIQRAEAPNRTGLPDQLKAGIESLSGLNMDHVQVHYNSDKPSQLQAHAYAQGSDIHVAPGQERHLPHEAWHIVQQAQGRVQPTTQMKGGVPVNDDAGLEAEADTMGARALAQGAARDMAQPELRAAPRSGSAAAQLAGHPEDLCFVGKWLVKRADSAEIAQYLSGNVPPSAPQFLGPFYTAQGALDALDDAGEVVAADKLAKIQLMAQTMSVGGKGFMLLANATSGLYRPEMRDLKMGKHTVSGTDQERHDVTGLGKVFKVLRHDAMDLVSGSAERGYRDEDRWQLSPMGDNTDTLQHMLDRASFPALHMIHDDLANFKRWLASTTVIYVGMSLLVIAGGDHGKAVAIDFEHPIFNTDESFAIHLEGLLTGANSLLDLVGAFQADFVERAARRETIRRAKAERDLQRNLASIRAANGKINASDEGNLAIGNEDL